jgi:hypothetical protein
MEFARFQLNTPSRRKVEDQCEKKKSMRERLLSLKGQSSDSRILSFHEQASQFGNCEFQCSVSAYPCPQVLFSLFNYVGRHCVLQEIQAVQPEPDIVQKELFSPRLIFKK